MKLFCPAVNVNKKEVVKKEIFDKVILIVSFLIGNKKALYLESRNFTYPVTVLVLSLYLNNILRNTIVINLEILVAKNKLAVCL